MTDGAPTGIVEVMPEDEARDGGEEEVADEPVEGADQRHASSFTAAEAHCPGAMKTGEADLPTSR